MKQAAKWILGLMMALVFVCGVMGLAAADDDGKGTPRITITTPESFDLYGTQDQTFSYVIEGGEPEYTVMFNIYLYSDYENGYYYNMDQISVYEAKGEVTIPPYLIRSEGNQIGIKVAEFYDGNETEGEIPEVVLVPLEDLNPLSMELKVGLDEIDLSHGEVNLPVSVKVTGGSGAYGEIRICNENTHSILGWVYANEDDSYITISRSFTEDIIQISAEARDENYYERASYVTSDQQIQVTGTSGYRFTIPENVHTGDSISIGYEKVADSITDMELRVSDCEEQVSLGFTGYGFDKETDRTSYPGKSGTILISNIREKVDNIWMNFEIYENGEYVCEQIINIPVQGGEIVPVFGVSFGEPYESEGKIKWDYETEDAQLGDVISYYFITETENGSLDSRSAEIVIDEENKSGTIELVPFLGGYIYPWISLSRGEYANFNFYNEKAITVAGETSIPGPEITTITANRERAAIGGYTSISFDVMWAEEQILKQYDLDYNCCQITVEVNESVNQYYPDKTDDGHYEFAYYLNDYGEDSGELKFTVEVVTEGYIDSKPANLTIPFFRVDPIEIEAKTDMPFVKPGEELKLSWKITGGSGEYEKIWVERKVHDGFLSKTIDDEMQEKAVGETLLPTDEGTAIEYRVWATDTNGISGSSGETITIEQGETSVSPEVTITFDPEMPRKGETFAASWDIQLKECTEMEEAYAFLQSENMDTWNSEWGQPQHGLNGSIQGMIDDEGHMALSLVLYVKLSNGYEGNYWGKSIPVLGEGESFPEIQVEMSGNAIFSDSSLTISHQTRGDNLDELNDRNPRFRYDVLKDNAVIWSNYTSDSWTDQMTLYANDLGSNLEDGDELTIAVTLEAEKGYWPDITASQEVTYRRMNYDLGELTWDYLPETQSIVFSGQGEIPDYEEFSKTEWASLAGQVKEVIFGQGIAAIGANTFNGFGGTLRADFNQPSLPTIRDNAFGGTVIYRYYTEDNSFENAGSFGAADSKWIYLPVNNQDHTLSNVFYTDKDQWYLTTDAPEWRTVWMTTEQMLEVTYQSRGIYLYTLPQSAEDLQVLSTSPDTTYSVQFMAECEGSFTYTVPVGTRNKVFLYAYAPNLQLTIEDPANYGIQKLEMTVGTITANTNMYTLLLRSYNEEDAAKASLIVNGDIEELIFYDRTAQDDYITSIGYLGDATVNGKIVSGAVHGRNLIAIPNISDEVDCGSLAQTTFEGIQQSEPVVIHGDLNILDESKINKLNLESAEIIFYDYYCYSGDDWRLNFAIQAEEGNQYHAEVNNIRQYNQDFTFDDIVWGENTNLTIAYMADKGLIQLNGGTDAQGQKTGLSQLDIFDCLVELNCPVDKVWIPSYGTVRTELKIQNQVNTLELPTWKSSYLVQTGAGGHVTGGYWTGRLASARYFDEVGADTIILQDGTLRVLNWKYGQSTRSITPTETELMEAAGLDDSSRAVMEIDDSQVEDLSNEEREALEVTLEEENGDMNDISSVFSISVDLYHVDDEGGAVYQGNLSELSSEVPIVVENPTGRMVYILRLHRKDDRIYAERITEPSADRLLRFKSHLFSQYLMVLDSDDEEISEEWTLHLPGGTLELGEEALAGIGAKQIYVNSGCKTIGVRAFANNAQLVRIHLTADVSFMDDTALEGCGQVTIYAPAGSYAESWAKTNSVPFVEEN